MKAKRPAPGFEIKASRRANGTTKRHYCPTRDGAEAMAKDLREHGWEVEIGDWPEDEAPDEAEDE